MNTNYILIYKLIIFLLIINSGCNKSQNKVIPPNKLAEIYIDLNLNTGINLLNDTLHAHDSISFVFDSVLQKHNYNRTDLLQTIENYNQDLSKWKEFYEITIDRLEKLDINSN